MTRAVRYNGHHRSTLNMTPHPRDASVAIRPLRPDDLEFMWRMLARAAHVPDAEHDTFRSDPELARLLSGWGRRGDRGVLAHHRDGSPLGAAWLRDADPADAGLVTAVSAEDPELVIAVEPGHEGRGVGSRLLAAVLTMADDDETEAIALSVRADNPAVRLYERHGFGLVEQITNRVGGQSLVMRRERPA